MHVVVMGCGRVGASIAQELQGSGHDVSIIDRDATAFRRLPEDFGGTKVKGVGFDQEVLRRAGIAEADAFAAVSSGDNSNIIAARVAPRPSMCPRSSPGSTTPSAPRSTNCLLYTSPSPRD